jgi:hypothetical protein
VPNIKKPAIVRHKTKIWSWAPDGSLTPRQTGRLTVSRKLTSSRRFKEVNIAQVQVEECYISVQYEDFENVLVELMVRLE